MRALWLIRRCLEQQLGGDTIQVLRTADALRRLGVEVVLAPAPGRDLGRFDVVHLFHLDRVWENTAHVRALRDSGLPVVLSPIFWVSETFDRHGRSLPQRMLARLGGDALRSVRLAYQWADQVRREPRRVTETRPVLGFRRGARAVLDAVDLVLPASVAEQRAMEALLGVQVPSRVVPGAADSRTFHPTGAPADRRGVLCAGRIEPRKNQLALLRALKGTGVPLTFVGKAGPTAAAYHRRCLQEAWDGVRFLSDLTSRGIAEEYRAAKVHASVSWYETPGLVNLEAALCGCTLVATRGGCTEEYLGEHARYCRPDDVADIRRTVLAALDDAPAEPLRQRILAEFTWEQAARHTLDAYQRVVGDRVPAAARGTDGARTRAVGT